MHCYWDIIRVPTLLKWFGVHFELETGIRGALNGCVHIPVRQHAQIDLLTVIILYQITHREIPAIWYKEEYRVFKKNWYTASDLHWIFIELKRQEYKPFNTESTSDNVLQHFKWCNLWVQGEFLGFRLHVALIFLPVIKKKENGNKQNLFFCRLFLHFFWNEL